MTNEIFSLVPKNVKKIKTKYREIKTHIPSKKTISLLKKIKNIESRSMHGQLPIVWNKAKNFQVTDISGNKWIDFSSTIFVANAGHGNKKISNALIKTIKKPLLTTYSYVQKERVNYIEYLINKTPDNFAKAFLLSAGTEATEVALKLMRLNGIKQGKSKGGIIALKGNWHGRTTGAQLMSGNIEQKQWIGFDDPNIHHIEFPYPWDDGYHDPKMFFNNEIKKLEKKGLDIEKDLCGFMIESFQGWGAIFYPKQFIKEIKKFTKRHKMLLTFDEMQAGFGRTGKLFGYMHYDVVPDLICCGKGASSSLPLSFVLGSKNIMDLPDEGSMSSTHSANPLSCVAGHENLREIIEKKLVSKSEKLGITLHNELEKLKNKYSNYIKYSFGKGLLASLIFYTSEGRPLTEFCSTVCEKAMQKGLILVHTGRESIKIGPPLTITKSALLEGISVLDESIFETISESDD